MAIYPNGRWRTMLWQNWMDKLPKRVKFWWWNFVWKPSRENAFCPVCGNKGCEEYIKRGVAAHIEWPPPPECA